MPIDAVVFDIGNVLVRWDPESYYDKTIGEDRRRAMFADVDLHQMNDVVDRGGSFRGTIYDYAETYPEWRDEIRMWHDGWIEMAQPVIAQSLVLMRALRAKGVAVYALTNFGVESFAYAETHYPFLGEFDRRYISGYMKVAKPDPEIYQMLEDDCKIAPGNLLFTDDRQENIEAAGRRGWQCHLFKDPQGWTECLMSHNLLTSGDI